MTHETQPQVFLVSRPQVDYRAMYDAITAMAGQEARDAQRKRWIVKEAGLFSMAQDLIEAGGRLCYKSWKPGVNKNVTRVRESQDEYLANIIKSGHGSVLEHANYTFIFANVSRVFTHELVRHKAGTAVSQESLRFVRLDDIGMWLPEWVKEDEDPMLQVRISSLLDSMENFQAYCAHHFGLDNPGVPFSEKKHKTSFMRRLAPDGVSTNLMWTCNVRELRHVITMRTEEGAEEEIHLVFDKVGSIMAREAPALFSDFTRNSGGEWQPEHRKV